MSDRVGSLLATVATLLAAAMGSSDPGESDNVIRGAFPQLPSEPPPEPPPEPDTWDVFLSYCEKDYSFAERIQVHLEPIRDEGVKIYDYNMVEPGAVVGDDARDALLTSVVAVLLISADYLASDLMKHELPDLLERAEEKKDRKEGEKGGQTRVLRLNVGPCDLDDMPRLTKYQEVGARKPPLRKLREPSQDEIYVELLRNIKKRLKDCGRYPKP